jgi:IS1 family transposase
MSMRKLNVEKRAEILNCLVEGLSIRATCRLTGAAKVTVLRLLLDAASVCARHHDRVVRDLATSNIQADEAWGFVGCKDRAKKRGASGHGNAWTWVAQDADSKLVISWIVGDRDARHANALMNDVAARVPGKVQVSTDSLNAYWFAIANAFGTERASYGVVHKTYASAGTKEDQRRYSPSVCVGCHTETKFGEPDEDLISTSFIERQNRDLRMRCRRMTRLTDGFSKRIENHAAATSLHYWAFNFAKKHATLKRTPAMAAGVVERPLTMLDLAQMIETEEQLLGSRLTNYLPSPKAEESK